MLMRGLRRGQLLRWGALVCTVAAMMVLLSFITLYSDDYEYAQYCRDGLSAFLEKTAAHYRGVNGRALIHAVAQVFLLAETRAYALLFPALLAGGLLLGYAAQTETAERRVAWDAAAGGTAVAMLVILALPVRYLNQTLCWIAGSFNYFFPLILLFAELFLLRRFVLGGRRSTLILTVLLALLCGATTEQVGCASLLCGLLLTELAIAREGASRLLRLAPLASLGGYATIVFAPGTSSRIAIDAGGSVLAILRDPVELFARFADVSAPFCGADGAGAILTALFLVLGGIGLVAEQSRLRPLVLAFPCAVARMLLLESGMHLAASLLVFFGLAAAAALLLTDVRLQVSGALILGALASVAMMTFTDFVAYRTMVPAILICIAVSVSLGSAALRCAPLRSAALRCAPLRSAALRCARAGCSLLPVRRMADLSRICRKRRCGAPQCRGS